mmetsp:Transcript_15682/g.15869  ORF Transcript_15682/g.15869 Transcript_15682/m.15869 type:complete len:91 (+) Transcript_15682:1170-1442(+)
MLESLQLNDNKIWGQIPDTFGFLRDMKTLNLDNNLLTGKNVPEELCALQLEYFVGEDASPSLDGIQCVCCTNTSGDSGQNVERTFLRKNV